MGVFFILATKHYIKNGFHLFKFHHFTTPLRVIPCSPLAPSTVCSPGLSLASFQAKANSFCPERETETKICSDAAEQYRHRKALPGQINNNVSETAVSGTSKTTFPHACVPLDLSENLMREDATTHYSLTFFYLCPLSATFLITVHLAWADFFSHVPTAAKWSWLWLAHSRYYFLPRHQGTLC